MVSHEDMEMIMMKEEAYTRRFLQQEELSTHRRTWKEHLVLLGGRRRKRAEHDSEPLLEFSQEGMGDVMPGRYTEQV